MKDTYSLATYTYEVMDYPKVIRGDESLEEEYRKCAYMVTSRIIAVEAKLLSAKKVLQDVQIIKEELDAWVKHVEKCHKEDESETDSQ